VDISSVKKLAAGLLVVVAMIGSACGSDGDSADDASDSSSSDLAQPGEGVEVEMARANWSTGYMQAAIYQQLLEELGYEVSDPSQSELDPATFFPAAAADEVDFWVNTWTPAHDFQFIDDVPEVADNVTSLGEEMTQGALQGVMVDKATADEYGITHIDQIAEDPELSKLFDTDGDGIADIHGCDVGWGCEANISEWIAANGWESGLTQISGSYTAVFTEAVNRVADGEPTLAYTWTPSAYVTELVPGDNVIWLATDKPLPEQTGASSLGEDVCPGQPCEMGFVANDIRVSANNEFLAANPAAEKLFELVKMDVTDVALQNVKYDGGEDTEEDVQRHASEWIADHQAEVDDWLQQAASAG
jgi:glycine betaine/proline transport system substrate-binding protein